MYEIMRQKFNLKYFALLSQRNFCNVTNIQKKPREKKYREAATEKKSIPFFVHSNF